MAKKRNMPHGRSIPKAKRVKVEAEKAALATQHEAASSETVPATSIYARPASSAPRSVLRTPPSGRSSRSGATGLTTDYRYVISDLKRIAVLAGATLIVLFGLTFVIR
ncbi:MAG: hypothetical protein M1396_01985 [Chloroflexi bacterium]|nr:hypothetical protein [Chloroflexota bacterium]